MHTIPSAQLHNAYDRVRVTKLHLIPPTKYSTSGSIYQQLVLGRREHGIIHPTCTSKPPTPRRRPLTAPSAPRRRSPGNPYRRSVAAKSSKLRQFRQHAQPPATRPLRPPPLLHRTRGEYGEKLRVFLYFAIRDDKEHKFSYSV